MEGLQSTGLPRLVLSSLSLSNYSCSSSLYISLVLPLFYDFFCGNFHKFVAGSGLENIVSLLNMDGQNILFKIRFVHICYMCTVDYAGYSSFNFHQLFFEKKLVPQSQI